MVAGRLRWGMGAVVDSAGFVPVLGIEVEMAAEAVLGAACRRCCRRSILRLPSASFFAVYTIIGWSSDGVLIGPVSGVEPIVPFSRK